MKAGERRYAMTWRAASALPSPSEREEGLVILAHYGYDTDIPTVLVWRRTALAAGSFRGWFGSDGHKRTEPVVWMPAPPRPIHAQETAVVEKRRAAH